MPKAPLIAPVLLDRKDVADSDTWNLGAMFSSLDAWENAFAKWEKSLGKFKSFKGRLGTDARTLAEALSFDSQIDREGDRIGTYAFLLASGDQSDSSFQRVKGRFMAAATKASEAAAFLRPEILAIPQAKMDKMLARPELEPWRLVLERLLRNRPHTLGDGEERLLAMQGQMAESASQIFRQLNDADLKFGKVTDEKGREIELTHSSFSALLQSPKRAVRAQAFKQLYSQFDSHKNTIAASLNASVQKDVYYAKVRGYKTAREAALFADNVPVKVYDNLVSTVRANLPAVHKYYDVRQRGLKLRDLHHYDCYVPIVSGFSKDRSWEQASREVIESLAPLGEDYCNTLAAGLSSERWCDRYPNRGKSSGAFSSGSYDGLPYILMNYQPAVMDHMFTLTHEAGHSMHSWYSAHHQPYQYYNYTIFVAEVASTFNEQLLLHQMLGRAKSDKERAYLINDAIDGIRGTIVRQTMFSEFETITHRLVEGGEPLTVETLRREYRSLLDAYFGPRFVIDPELELECLRIPHFYRAFYVYKYATGLSAAIALSQKVLKGSKKDLDAYLSFLKGGCSKWPIDLLRDAGVDMNRPKPIEAAMTRFNELVDELDSLV